MRDMLACSHPNSSFLYVNGGPVIGMLYARITLFSTSCRAADPELCRATDSPRVMSAFRKWNRRKSSAIIPSLPGRKPSSLDTTNPVTIEL